MVTTARTSETCSGIKTEALIACVASIDASNAIKRRLSSPAVFN